MDAELKQAYEQLEDAVRKITTMSITPEGMVVDFAVAVAIVGYDSEGRMIDGVEPILPDGGALTPRYRITGLLKELIVKYDAVAGADIIDELMIIEEEDDEE